jgi:hypothetical protein
MAVANNSENTRKNLFELGYIGPEARKIFDIIVANVLPEKHSTILEYRTAEGFQAITWELVVEYAATHAQCKTVEKINDTDNENRDWFLNSALPDILKSENPNTKNLYYMDSELDADTVSTLEYYVEAMNYAKRIYVNHFNIIERMIQNPVFLYYFLTGDEYQMLFAYCFESLSEDEKHTLIEKILISVPASAEDFTNLLTLFRRIVNSQIPEIPEERVEELIYMSRLILSQTDVLKNRIDHEYYVLLCDLPYDTEDDEFNEKEEKRCLQLAKTKCSGQQLELDTRLADYKIKFLNLLNY